MISPPIITQKRQKIKITIAQIASAKITKSIESYPKNFREVVEISKTIVPCRVSG